MRLIQRTGTKPTLKEVSVHTLGTIFPPRIPPVRFANRPGQRHLILWNRNKVRVICHQAPRQNLDSEPVHLLRHDLKVRSPIIVIAEDGD
jgi:hypothetical protein